jgi:ribose/xylose/arabinose/galactoside ABC-type transport system permease subunit
MAKHEGAPGCPEDARQGRGVRLKSVALHAFLLFGVLSLCAGIAFSQESKPAKASAEFSPSASHQRATG